MPRSVTPEGLIEESDPHTFSLGVCRLTMMIEFGSKDALAQFSACKADFSR